MRKMPNDISNSKYNLQSTCSIAFNFFYPELLSLVAIVIVYHLYFSALNVGNEVIEKVMNRLSAMLP